MTLASISLLACGKSNSKLTLANFNKIHTGMTITQVENILGPGEIMSESGDGQYHTVMKVWKGDGMSNMNVMFQGDLVQSKAQVGLD